MLATNKLAKLDNVFTIQDQFFLDLIKSKKLVKIFLKNGICLQGYIESYDNDVLILHNKEKQLIYKQCIATVLRIHKHL